MAFPLRVQEQIAQDNLHIQERSVSAVGEARRSHLSDLARLFVGKMPSGVPLPVALRAACDRPPLDPADMTPHREVLPQNRPAMAYLLHALSRYDRAVFAELVVARLSAAGRPPILSDFAPTSYAVGTVVCPPNSYTREALADLFPDGCARMPASDDGEAVETVLAGGADACLLPFCDLAGVPVRSTQDRLRQTPLCVRAVSTVTDGEGNPMQLALCSPCLYPEAAPDDTVYLVSRTPCAAELADVFDTLHLFGYTPIACHCAHGCTLTVRGGDPVRLAVWMTLFAPAFRVAGIYQEHHTEES